jgi:hypothetical protein
MCYQMVFKVARENGEMQLRVGKHIYPELF